MPRSALALWLLGWAVWAPALDNVRVDLIGKDDVDLTPFAITQGKGDSIYFTWNPPETQKRSRLIRWTIPPRIWTKLGFTVTVAKECEVSLQLSGPGKSKANDPQRIPLPVRYDQIEVTGTTLKNGGFETIDPTSGYPVNWWRGKDPEAITRPVTEGVKDGLVAMIAWHEGLIGQAIRLPAGKPVTITLYAYSDIDPEAK